MLNFDRFYVRVQVAIPDESDEVPTGSYFQRFYDAEDMQDAKRRARLDFGPGFEVVEALGPLAAI